MVRQAGTGLLVGSASAGDAGSRRSNPDFHLTWRQQILSRTGIDVANPELQPSYEILVRSVTAIHAANTPEERSRANLQYHAAVNLFSEALNAATGCGETSAKVRANAVGKFLTEEIVVDQGTRTAQTI